MVQKDADMLVWMFALGAIRQQARAKLEVCHRAGRVQGALPNLGRIQVLPEYSRRSPMEVERFWTQLSPPDTKPKT